MSQPIDLRGHTLESIRQTIKQTILIKNLELRGVTEADIGDDMPLFGEGLGLESVEAFYIAAGMQESFGIQIDRTKLHLLKDHFRSVHTLALFVAGCLADA